VVLFPDTASLAVEPIRGQVPEPSAARATLAAWAPGQMRIALEGSDPRPQYLLVGETWYPDWHALVDGRPAPVLRGDHALITVPVPAGAREVTLHFASAAYARGKLVSSLALAAIVGLIGWSFRRRSRADA
jgi:hypothetical protein